jgi:hypothetical protein
LFFFFFSINQKLAGYHNKCVQRWNKYFSLSQRKNKKKQMNLMIFWLKIAIKRIIEIFRLSPVIVIWTVIIIAAFIVSEKNIVITLNVTRLVILLSAVVVISLFVSLKNYHVTPVLILYSKSGSRNRTVCVRFFIKRAVKNNMPVFIFAGLLKTDCVPLIIAAAFFSVFLSFLIMFLKNNYLSRRINQTAKKIFLLNPVVKSTVYDYLTSDFLLTALTSIALLIIITVEFIKNHNLIHETDNSSVFFIMTAVLSVGFIGIIDSIANINWKFHSIICPQKYFYHLNRTLIFLCAFSALPVTLSVAATSFVNPAFVFRHLYCLIVILTLSVDISFFDSNMFIKSVLSVSAAAFTIWVGALNVYLLLILPAPVLIALVKANNDYREWYLL